MIINIIHDSRAKNRGSKLLLKLLEMRAAFRLWPAVEAENPIKGINLAHKQIVRWAKERGDEMCCIAEDDFWFPHRDGLKYFIENMPERFNMYFGGFTSTVDQVLNENKKWVNRFSGMHFYVIKKHFYDYFLGTSDDNHIDLELSKLGTADGIVYDCAYPYVCIQEDNDDNVSGVSALECIKGKKVFGLNVF